MAIPHDHGALAHPSGPVKGLAGAVRAASGPVHQLRDMPGAHRRPIGSRI